MLHFFYGVDGPPYMSMDDEDNNTKGKSIIN